MRHRLFLTALVALLALPAVARADDDLEGYLESAAGADFHGVGVVMCTWGVDSAATTYEVTRSDGMSMVHGPDGDLMLSGALTATKSGADWYALEVGEWAAWRLSSRYTLGEARSLTRLGRPATEVVVMEDDRVRARLVIDEESTVPLLTEILDGEGNLFRIAAMIDFEDAADVELHMPESYHDHEMLMPGRQSPRLPSEVFGYERANSYAGKSNTQTFYTDGLFSFSVFESKRGRLPEAFENATVFVVDGKPYRRIVTPSNVWVQWDAPDHTYVLVGDLPPDHIEAVLTELPDPGNRGFIVRLWRRLFG